MIWFILTLAVSALTSFYCGRRLERSKRILKRAEFLNAETRQIQEQIISGRDYAQTAVYLRGQIALQVSAN